MSFLRLNWEHILCFCGQLINFYFRNAFNKYVGMFKNDLPRLHIINMLDEHLLKISANIIEVKIILGGSVATICALQRMVTRPSDKKVPFKLNCRQSQFRSILQWQIIKIEAKLCRKLGCFYISSFLILTTICGCLKNKERKGVAYPLLW